jgi:catechol 2,3-dioxygenase-like lactoylglutathione lyase family enzyme
MTTTNTTGLGNFSVSLAVKDLAASKAFYLKLGFEPMAGDGTHFLIMQSGTTTIGLFHGMFDHNILTFNPGWDHKCDTLPEFADVRELQRRVRAQGIEPITPVDESAKSGPANFTIVDPDGNRILFDQHVS